MSDNSEMVDAKETPLTDVIDDSCTVDNIQTVPPDRPSDDCYQLQSVDPVGEVKLGDVQNVKQEPADDETDNEANIPHYAVKVRS